MYQFELVLNCDPRTMDAYLAMEQDEELQRGVGA